MSLPNPNMDFTPFSTLPAADLNDMVENIEALADGSGLDNTSISSAKLNLSKTTDANGWTVYDFGTFKIYRKRVAYSVNKVAGEYSTITTTNLPVGLATIGANFVSAGITGGAIDDMYGGIKQSSTAATTLPVSVKFSAAGVFAGWVDYEIRTA